MIFDTLENSTRYESLNSRFAMAFAYLRTVDGTQKLGRHDLDGDACFALVQTYETKPHEGAKFEAHRKYIDVQFIHRGRETILWAPLSSMKEETIAPATWSGMSTRSAPAAPSCSSSIPWATERLM